MVILHLVVQLTGKTLTIDLGSGYNGHKVKIIVTISTSVVGAKTKTTTDTTTTIDTEALATATTISLGKADIHTLTTVHMAVDFSTVYQQQQVIQMLQVDLI